MPFIETPRVHFRDIRTMSIVQTTANMRGSFCVFWQQGTRICEIDSPKVRRRARNHVVLVAHTRTKTDARSGHRVRYPRLGHPLRNFRRSITHAFVHKEVGERGSIFGRKGLLISEQKSRKLRRRQNERRRRLRCYFTTWPRRHLRRHPAAARRMPRHELTNDTRIRRPDRTTHRINHPIPTRFSKPKHETRDRIKEITVLEHRRHLFIHTTIRQPRDPLAIVSRTSRRTVSPCSPFSPSTTNR